MAVYGQVTGKPKNDPPPPPPGLPDATPEDKGPSGDDTKGPSGESSTTPKTSASTSKDFREVEGSKDLHMRWNPSGSYRKSSGPSTSHFTAATSPTRSRDFV